MSRNEHFNHGAGDHLDWSPDRPGFVQIGGRVLPAVSTGVTTEGHRTALVPLENGGMATIQQRRGTGRGLGDVADKTYWDVFHARVNLDDHGSLHEQHVESVQNFPSANEALGHLDRMAKRPENLPDETQQAEHRRVVQHLRSRPDVWWDR